jgi:Tol biopolymer transport system component
MRGVAFATLVVAAVLTTAATSAAQYQPRLTFRVIATPHFRIYYHQGLEPLARRLAGIAESAHSTLPNRLRLQAPPVTHVVLANQDDEANGLATPIPNCTVRVTAAWPPLSDLVGNTNDWLRLVFTHEYVHVLQLNQSVGWATLARRVFGRSPVAFPNLFLPQWQIEGFATFWESRSTGLGRLNAGDSTDIVRSRAGLPGGEPLDRANGGAVDWPGGYAVYLEGASFYDYLATRFGEDAVGRLALVTAGRVPYLSAPATRRVFGESLGDLWKDFQRDVREKARALPLSADAGRRLTTRGYFVTSPRYDGAGRTVVYSVQDADDFPALLTTDVATGATRRIADRLGGSQVSARDGLLVFDRVDLVDNVASRSDLFAADIRTGHAIRLTRNARLQEPDLSPDGKRLVCIRIGDDGRRELAFFTLGRDRDDRPLPLAPLSVPVPLDHGASYGAPRWSPDGRFVAVERRRIDGPSEIVVLDISDGRERVVASSATTRNLEPAWVPDGRTILFSSDRIDRSFQIYAASLGGDSLRRVTDVRGGARYPDVSPDGQRVVYVGSSADGYDLFELAVDPARWTAVPPALATSSPRESAPAAVEAGEAAGDDAAALATTSYSPFPTLLPRAWLPLADSASGSVRVGFAVSGADMLLRHSVDATFLWRLGDTTAVDGPHRGRPDWSAGYVYGRWRTALFVVASDKTSFLRLAASRGGVAPDAELREQAVAAGVALPIQHVRHAQFWQAGLNVERHTLAAASAATPRYRNAFRAAWAINTGKVYGRSISPEDGIAGAVTSEQVRTAFGADGNADAFTAELRAYLRPGTGHGVLALRAGYGVATGDLGVRRQFYLGGTSSAGSLVDFGTDALRMLRGFGDQVFSGTHTAVASVEWRQPAWRIERGWGTVPVYVRTFHGTVFADAGQAWMQGFYARQAKTSAGVEGSVDVVAGYRLPLTLTAGIAWTRDGEASGRRGRGVYFRFGPSF